MQEIVLTQDEFEEFRYVQIQPRWDWPATFSCNKFHQVWPQSAWGFTDEARRVYLERQIPQLDQIVEVVLSERPLGGRFFISDKGVFLKPKNDEIQIARFTIV